MWSICLPYVAFKDIFNSVVGMKTSRMHVCHSISYAQSIVQSVCSLQYVQVDFQDTVQWHRAMDQLCINCTCKHYP